MTTTDIPEWLRFAKIEPLGGRRTARTLEGLCEELQTTLQITEHQMGRWTCSLYGVEVKDGIGLTSLYGTGATPDSAAIDYAHQLKGKLLVVNAMSRATRRELQVGLVLAAAA